MRKRFVNPKVIVPLWFLWCGRLKVGEHALLELHYWSQHLQEASTAFPHDQTLSQLCPTAV